MGMGTDLFGERVMLSVKIFSEKIVPKRDTMQ